jgi:hypothetical protein
MPRELTNVASPSRDLELRESYLRGSVCLRPHFVPLNIQNFRLHDTAFRLLA